MFGPEVERVREGEGRLADEVVEAAASPKPGGTWQDHDHINAYGSVML